MIQIILKIITLNYYNLLLQGIGIHLEINCFLKNISNAEKPDCAHYVDINFADFQTYEVIKVFIMVFILSKLPILNNIHAITSLVEVSNYGK